jgi:hypothetical protein
MHQGNAYCGSELQPGILCVVLWGVLPSSSTAAQDARLRRSADPTTPSPAHERMKLFEGTWAAEPDPYFREGSATWRSSPMMAVPGPSRRIIAAVASGSSARAIEERLNCSP